MKLGTVEREHARLALAEGWELEKIDGELKVIAQDKEFPLRHPFEIHLRIYRDIESATVKLAAMHRLHDMLWPEHALTWNRWQEEMFWTHCAGYKTIVWASGAGAGKSMGAAKIGTIFWLSDPLANAVLVASTTLTSLNSRIWGYVSNLFTKGQRSLPIQGNYYRSKPPKLLYPGQTDEIHGMFANAIPEGEDEDTIKNIIGRHPDKRLLVILDEATEMNPAIAKGIPNLERGVIFFQMIAIGNSNSRYDLHGSLATPLKGWDNLRVEEDRIWPTTQDNGIALYMHPEESPAITETDEVKKMALGKFLLTKEQLQNAKKKYTEDSESYYRFTLGFWRRQAMDTTAISEQFLNENQVNRLAEWGGYNALNVVGGLDPAFQLGSGDGCILQLAIWGQTLQGKMVLDYRGDRLLFRVPLMASLAKSTELQICDFVCEKCLEFGCSPANIAIDATGVGRALAELMVVRWKKMTGLDCEAPYRIISTRPKKVDGKTDPNVVVLGASDMYLSYRTFIQQGHINGLPEVTIEQLKSRQIKEKNGKLILETKKEYKDRMNAIKPSLARSPDESDAAVLSAIACVLRFGFYPGMFRPVPNVAERFINEKMAAANGIMHGGSGVGGNGVVNGGGGPGSVSLPRLRPGFSTSLADASEHVHASRTLRRV